MSAMQPVRCLFARRLAASPRLAAAATKRRAAFHTSTQLNKRVPRFKSIAAREMGLNSPENIQEYTEKTFPHYSPEELEILKKKYTPEQMEALMAGEAAIDPKDLTIQGRLRLDPYRLPYLDDFSKIKPVIDRKVSEGQPPDLDARFMTVPEMMEDMGDWMSETVPEHLRHLLDDSAAEKSDAETIAQLEASGMGDKEIEKEMAKVTDARERLTEKRLAPLNDYIDKVATLEVHKYLTERSSLTDNNAKSKTSLAPDLGRHLEGVAGHFSKGGEQELKVHRATLTIQRNHGITGQNIREIEAKIVVNRKVTNQTRLGKVFKSWKLAVAGNGDGFLGVGVAKSTEPMVASAKAKLLALQNMVPIPRYENRTVYGNLRAKFGSTIVEISARPPGFGVRASHRLFEIFRIAGIHDVAAKMPRGRNPMNSAKACIQALCNQQDPEQLAVARGRKFVDVRKVYYNGKVY